MRKLAISITMLLVLCMMSGCSKKETRDTYIEGTDFQYQYFNSSTYIGTEAKGEDCTYFVVGSYVYQLDNETQTMTPLCNKSNCLHDKEADENRVSDCNAYLEETDDVGIAYMDGYVYSVTEEWKDNDICNVLYKISADGAVREKVYQWSAAVVESWCLHRNVLYYIEHTYGKENKEFYKVKKLDLGGITKAEPKVIYEPAEDITVFAFDTLQAYGNHLYINVNGVKTEDVEKVAGKDWAKYSYDKTFEYNLQNGTLSEIQVPNQTDTEQVSRVAFWQDKLLICAMDCAKIHEYDTTNHVYIADLDGRNATVLMKDMPSYRQYSSDGTYLYVSDCPEALDRIYSDSDYQYNINHNVEVEYNFTVNIDVYDKDMELVDRMQSPIKSFPTELPYGSGDRMYVLEHNGDGERFSILYWDKTKLGTYQGKEYSFTQLLEQKYSSHDLQQSGEDSEEE